MYMYFNFFFPVNRVRVSNPQRLSSTQIMVEYPLPTPSRGEVLNVSCLKAEIIIQVFLSCLLLFFSVCE